MSRQNNSNEKFKSKIGGQALIEGIMMLGVNTGAMACRLPDGTIDVETWEEKNGKKYRVMEESSQSLKVDLT